MPFIVIIYLVIMVLLVPFLNLYNLQLMEKEVLHMPSKKKLYFQSAVNQLALAGLALWAAWQSQIQLSYTSHFSAAAIIAALVFVGAGFVLTLISTRVEGMQDENKGLDMLKPETTQEKWIWAGVNLVASACEEIMFRGVLYFIFYKTSHNMYVAAAMSALCFGFSHSIQGRMAIAATIIFALGLQYMAHISGGLLLPMAAHFLHNMLTTLLLLQEEDGADGADNNQNNSRDWGDEG